MTSPRLFGLLCVRNEADRYLRDCLAWNGQALDDVFVYDDLSTDDSIAVALLTGATVDVRSEDVPPFLEHEGRFRQGAWEAFELAMRPTAGDWVLAFDADEFLAYPSSIDPCAFLRDVACSFTRNGYVGCKLKIHEVFGVEGDAWYVRTDGFWGDITGLRFFEYRHGGKFANRRMGCGSAPTYAQRVGEMTALELFHLGYARAADRVDKYNRYFGLPGHSAQHVASILDTDVALTPWQSLMVRHG